MKGPGFGLRILETFTGKVARNNKLEKKGNRVKTLKFAELYRIWVTGELPVVENSTMQWILGKSLIYGHREDLGKFIWVIKVFLNRIIV